MLNQAWSVYLASPDHERLERQLYGAPDFALSGKGESADAEWDILRLCPDLLILDAALTGMDGLELLERLGREMAAPPRVLFLCRVRQEAWAELARKRGADAVCFWPEEEILPFARRAIQAVLPALSGPWEETRSEIAGELLHSLGVGEHLKGKQYMRDAAAMLACAPQLAQSFSRRLYPLLAEKFGVTPAAVERDIRTAVEYTWLKGSLNAIQTLFGFSVDADRGKPTNAEFLSMLAEHTRRLTAHRMARKKP